MSRTEYILYVEDHLRLTICSQIWQERRIRPSCSYCLEEWDKVGYHDLFRELYCGIPIQPSCSQCHTVWLGKYEDLSEFYHGTVDDGDLHLRCVRWEEGCRWTGKYWMLRTHLERECCKSASMYMHACTYIRGHFQTIFLFKLASL